MGRYFGTDGIRGKANEGLTAERAFVVGRYLGYYYSKTGKQKIIIGKDTRLSSDMLENALAAGISSEGCDAYLAGYCPTPMVCYLTVHEDFACGAMISASHNPFYDNGIKVFSKEGIKLQGEVEELIEDYIDGKETIAFKTGSEIGKVIRYDEGIEHYLDWVTKEYPLDLKDMHIAIDCSNGSASYTAARALKKLGAEVVVKDDTPTGININKDCGSTHPENFIAFMKANEGKFDLGLTFDGDADRQIAVAPNGKRIDGDYVLYICGRYYKAKGTLTNNTIVTTVMANLGLWKAMEKNGINVEKTDVGDKYVYDMMCKKDYIIGGEQSGHIIFKHHETTGDGLVTALALLKIMKETGKPVEELMEGLRIYPQLLVNVKVTDKSKVMGDPHVQKAIDEVNEELNGNGRILVRPSGTEPLLRVMAEAETDEICDRVVGKIARVIQKKYGVEE
jgi:phosphoglucosamine mutase